MLTATKIGEIPSDSDPNRRYNIYQDISIPDKFSCNCPSWTKSRHKIKNGQCKHIRQFLASPQPNSFNSKRSALSLKSTQFNELGSLVDHLDRLTSDC